VARDAGRIFGIWRGPDLIGGVLRKSFSHKGVFHDSMVLSILAEEWAAA
jgi:hypothetical protein